MCGDRTGCKGKKRTLALNGVCLEAADTTIATNRYAWDLNAPLPMLAVERQDVLDDESTETTRRTYTHAGATTTAIATTTATGSQDAYLHPDHLGSTQAVTDPTGDTDWTYDYTPYGEARDTTRHDDLAPDNPLQYTGQYQDPTGLYHLRARQYDPTTGRFTATDPWKQPLTDPYVNLYSYADARPTVLVDPSGWACQKFCVSGVI